MIEKTEKTEIKKDTTMIRKVVYAVLLGLFVLMIGVLIFASLQ